MIVVFTGLPGAGKSLKLASTVVDVLYRNRKYFQKTGSRRILYTNLSMSAEVLAEFDGFVKPWTELRELVALRDCDVVIDEIATYFDARHWEHMTLEMRRWLAQHRKFGIEIYGTAQDFAQADKAFRRLTSDLLYLTKLIGSRDISPTKPTPRWIWGIVLVQSLDPTVYDEQTSKFNKGGAIPRIMFISRQRASIFDTRAEVKPSTSLPREHVVYTCELPSCAFHKVVHV